MGRPVVRHDAAEGDMNGREGDGASTVQYWFHDDDGEGGGGEYQRE